MPDVVCKECIFAKYEEDTQTECSKGMLKKFERVGEEVLECYDEEKEFFVIKNRSCICFRKQNWLDFHKDNADEQLEKELKFSFNTFIFINDKTSSLDKTIESLNKQVLRPSKVTIICDSKNHIKPRIIKDMMPENCVPWKLDNNIRDTKNDKSIMLQNNKCNYITIIKCGEVVRPDYFELINNSIVENLLRFAMIYDTTIQTIPLQVFNHWFFNGKTNSVVEDIYQYKDTVDRKCVYSLEELK